MVNIVSKAVTAAAVIAVGAKADGCPRGFRSQVDSKGSSVCIGNSHPGSCPHGSVPSGASCVRETVMPPNRRCEKGAKLMGGKCMSTSTVEKECGCPKGFDRVGDSCVRTGRASDPTLVCEKGRLHQGKCVKREKAEYEMSCPKGSTQRGGQCVATEQNAAQVACPKGLHFDGNNCVGESTAEVTKVCPGDSVPSYGNPSECVQRHHTAATAVCEGTRVKDACATISTAPKKSQCPDDFKPTHLKANDGGALCEKCKSGAHKTTSSCEYRPAHLVCDEGFQNVGDHCKMEKYIGFTYECKGKDEELKKGADGNPYCERVEQIGSAQSTCEKGYTVEGDKCVARRSSPPKFSCPKSATLEGKMCETEVLMKPEYSCPEGMTERAFKHGCTRTVLLGEPTPRCPQKAELVDDKCVRSTVRDLSCSCPAGSVPQALGHAYGFGFGRRLANDGGSCTTKAFSDAHVDCPAGFTLESNFACSSVSETPRTCGKGETLRQNGDCAVIFPQH